MESYNMKSPLIDVIGFCALLASLPWIHWFLANEPYMRAVGSYGAAVVVVWRVGVLGRRAYGRWMDKRRQVVQRLKNEQS